MNPGFLLGNLRKAFDSIGASEVKKTIRKSWKAMLSSLKEETMP